MTTIHILGTGCAKCNKLYELADEVAKELGIEYEIIKVTDMMKFIDFGVMITPALVVNGKLKVAGKIPSTEEVKKFLSE